jgi:phosphoribosyl 1,2-cyclic phosphate phosphodiesterase
MEIVLLGTAAAEGWPAPFCVCRNCEEARKRGGSNIRTRSGALIDDELKIDFCPDTVVQMQRTGRNLSKVKTLLFTHQHSDHLVASELEWAVKPFTQTPPEPIHTYGNSEVIAEINRAFGKLADTRKNLVLHEIKAGDHFTTPTGEEVWAMRADHVQGATVLRIRRNGKVIFYGHDSGLYPDEALEQLSDGIALDVALLDCTNGSLDVGDRGHMGVNGVVKMVRELRTRGAITDRTRVIATHFSHNGAYLHEELLRAFLPHGIDVAFDGMAIKV